jgi:hypothetical protein
VVEPTLGHLFFFVDHLGEWTAHELVLTFVYPTDTAHQF